MEALVQKMTGIWRDEPALKRPETYQKGFHISIHATASSFIVGINTKFGAITAFVNFTHSMNL